MSTAKTSMIWQIALYVASAFAVLATISGALSTGGWMPIVLLIPMLGLVLPPLRNKIDPSERYLPGPKWSLGVMFVLVLVQGVLFGQHAAGVEAEREVKRQREAADRLANARRGLSEEYSTNKAQILGQIEQLMASNQVREVATLANKFSSVSKDPDLARLKGNVDLAVMELELANESALSLTRREQIYKTLIRDKPGALAKYQEKLKEVTAALEVERKAKAEAAERAALEARIKGQFSGWDGSHRNVESALKARMKNPKSYEHVETRYRIENGVITVLTTYRGTNSFGAVVTNSAVATVDMDGNVLTLSSL